MGSKQRMEDGKRMHSGILRGVVIAAMVTLAGTGVLAAAENGGGVDSGGIISAENGIRALAAFVGCLAAGKKGRGAVSAVMVSALYCTILLLTTTVCFGGRFESLLIGIMTVVSGMVFAVIFRICISGHRSTQSTRRRHR